MFSAHPSSRLILAALGMFAAGLAIGTIVHGGGLGLHVLRSSPGSAGEAGDIFATNLSRAAMIGVLGGAVALLRLVGEGPPGYRLFFALADFLVALFVCVNAIAAGIAVGALGAPVLARVAPHAPFELAGFACAIALYLDARSARLRVERALWLICGAITALGWGAVMESFVSGAL